MSIFRPAQIRLPGDDDMEKWPVIACDQFSSQPEYWDAVKKTVGDAPSTLNIIFPEIYIGQGDEERIASINEKMKEYLADVMTNVYEDSFVYVERTLGDGTIRMGVVGMIDLNYYSYQSNATSAIRASERTILERIPPRMHIRRGAQVEVSHVLLLCDDAACTLIEFLRDRKETLPKLYDFDLMEGGGHIRGYLVTGNEAESFKNRVEEYEISMRKKYDRLGEAPVIYAVGDGNHSVATAKEIYEQLRRKNPGKDLYDHPAKFTLVELENIHHSSQQFEPIHRIVKNTNPKAMLEALEEISLNKESISENISENVTENVLGNSSETGADDDSFKITVVWEDNTKDIILDKNKGKLAIIILQNFLDKYLKTHSGEPDYIHGADTVKELSARKNTVGFILPDINKDDFFEAIAADGVFPRKTFSIGHAKEKRYYLEARKIIE